MVSYAVLSTPSSTKRIAVAFRLSGEPGRRKFGGFLRYVNEHQLDWQLQLIRIREDFTRELVASFPERQIDGIVYSLPSEKDVATELAKLEIPTIALEDYDGSMLNGRMRNLVSILGDTEDVGRLAARNLMTQGLFKSYGFVADLQGSVWGKLRGAAFMDEIKRNGLPVHRYTTRGKGYDLPNLANWISRLQKPAGVFAAFDDRAIQIIEACREAKAAIPGDVAILGVDNDEMLCTNTTPTLSSVQPDHDAMGYLAAERLEAMMDGERLARPESHLIGVKEIVVRESTCAISTAGRLVQRALAYIRTHATEAIKPRDVAAYLKVSRSLADLRFRELQNESIGDAIRRYRLEEVRRRLVSSNDKIENIADQCHFSKLCRLNDAFKAEYGVALKDYRQSHRKAAISVRTSRTAARRCCASPCGS